MYKFKPFPILFYLKQLSAVVFGKQECSDMYIYLRTKASFVPVFMCAFKIFPETRGAKKPNLCGITIG